MASLGTRDSIENFILHMSIEYFSSTETEYWSICLTLTLIYYECKYKNRK